jgi:aspartate racemase
MHHAGILAHSVEGASLCLVTFCRDGFRALGPHDHPDVTLDCIVLGRSMAAWASGDYAAVRLVLAKSVTRLARAGADLFVCPDNTAHIALEQPGPLLALPGLHIAEILADHAAHQGHRVVGVLGTKWTMEGPVYPRALASRGIQAVIPEAADRQLVDRIIFDELVNGIVADTSRAEYLRVILELERQGCDAVALACTEIPLLVTPQASPLAVLDSTRLLAQAAFQVATDQQPMPAWRGGPPSR